MPKHIRSGAKGQVFQVFLSVLDHNDVFGPFSDTDFLHFLNEASRVGMSVVTSSQIQGIVDPIDQSLMPQPEIDAESASAWLVAYREHMLERAEFYENAGLEYWTIDCNPCSMEWIWGSPSEIIQIYAEFYDGLIDEIRNIFTGNLGFNFGPVANLNPSIMSKVDYIRLGLNPWHFDGLSENFTVDEFVEHLGKFSNAAPAFEFNTINAFEHVSRFTDVIFVEFGVQSRADAATSPGYLEETVCTAGVQTGRDLLDVDYDDCAQANTPTSFSLQAVVIEATLRVIDDMNITSNIVAMPTSYWVTENFFPQTAFPNLGESPRNKIAENIIYNWYQKGADDSVRDGEIAYNLPDDLIQVSELL
jgi:hypothetical protein